MRLGKEPSDHPSSMTRPMGWQVAAVWQTESWQPSHCPMVCRRRPVLSDLRAFRPPKTWRRACLLIHRATRTIERRAWQCKVQSYWSRIIRGKLSMWECGIGR